MTFGRQIPIWQKILFGVLLCFLNLPLWGRRFIQGCSRTLSWQWLWRMTNRMDHMLQIVSVCLSVCPLGSEDDDQALTVMMNSHRGQNITWMWYPPNANRNIERHVQVWDIYSGVFICFVRPYDIIVHSYKLGLFGDLCHFVRGLDIT